MEKELDLNKLPIRVKYYLLEWKDNNIDDYVHKYGNISLRELNVKQLSGLFYYATSKDGIILNNL